MTPRKLAYQILKTAYTGATYSNIALDNALKKYELSEADRGLLTAIVMGVTERRLTLDHLIDALARDPAKIEPEARILLQMGIYQILYLDRIPAYAAVNESVELAGKRAAGFVNAILRELLRRKEKKSLQTLFPSEANDPAGYLSVTYSFPAAVCRRFVKLYGYEEAKETFAAFNRPPALTLRTNPLKINRADYAALLEEKGITYRLSERLENAVLLDGVSFPMLPGFDEGYFFVQDEASQICVEALDAQPGDFMIDACACPGSKSFGAALKMGNKGKILSFDLHESKLKLIEKSALRLGIGIIEAKQRDGRIFEEALEGRADRVLCDVPCSGLGVIGKKPEIRYKDMDEFARLPDIQLAILENNARYVKAGGVLVYSTCTVLPEENRENVARFLEKHPEFEPIDFKAGGLASEDGSLSLAPHIHHTDGFFVAKFTRK